MRDIAAFFNVAETTVTKWIRQGQLRALRVGRGAGYRIRVTDLDQFVATRETQTSQPDRAAS